MSTVETGKSNETVVGGERPNLGPVGRIPQYKMSSFVVPDSVTLIENNYPASKDAKTMAMTQENILKLLSKLGVRNAAEIDEEERVSAYMDRIAKGVDEGLIVPPDYFPRTACIVDVTGKCFGGINTKVPASSSGDMHQEVREAVLHQACMRHDAATPEVLFDPRYMDIHGAGDVFRAKGKDVVKHMVFRLPNLAVPEDAEQTQVVPDFSTARGSAEAVADIDE
jgi:hypothetical protein